MSLFGKDKKNFTTLRPLTEDEIQRRLYGAYRPEKTSNAAGPSKSAKEALNSSHALGVKEKKPHSTEIQDDLFTSTKPPEPIDAAPQNSISAPEQLSEQERMRRLSEIAEKEKRRPPPYLKADPWKKGATKPPEPLSGVSAAAAGKSLVKFLGLIIKFVINFITTIFALLFRMISLIDLRKPQVRRIVYWLTGVLVLFSLFVAVHVLNVQREAAMQTPAVASSAQTRSDQPPQKAAAANKQEVPASKERKQVHRESRLDENETLRPATKEEETVAEPAKSKKSENEAPHVSDVSIAPPVSEGRYVIQVATYASTEDANRLVEQFKREKISVFARALGRPGGRTYYAVFIGRFETFQAAQQRLEKFRKNDAAAPFDDAFIRTLEA